MVLYGIFKLEKQSSFYNKAIPSNTEHRVALNFILGENFEKLKKRGTRVWIVKIMSTVVLVALCIIDFLQPES